ncbi:MAG: hypothetical protein KR126chlam1_00284 [Chlamydiae bacterium]|nr:hypothetical protein [Chlamydiota bacterium]
MSFLVYSAVCKCSEYIHHTIYATPIRLAEEDVDLTEEASALAKQMGITRPITVWNKASHACSAFGTKIAIDPSTSDGVRSFFLARELTHIKYRDNLWTVVVVLTTSIAFAILLIPSVGFLTADVLGYLLGIFVFISYRSFVNMRAEKTAMKYITPEQRAGAVRHFKLLRTENLSWRNDPEVSIFDRIYRKSLIRKDGESRFAPTEPTIASRIRWLK